jgi:hypothetical protein
MSSSIYIFVKNKLLTHGAQYTKNGALTITDKRLFLHFVRLERAVRLEDFAAVQLSVEAIERITLLMGKQSLALFAYMYLYFSDANVKITHADIALDEGMIRKTFDYRRKVSSAERLIADWAGVWYERYSKSFSRALYQSEKAD